MTLMLSIDNSIHISSTQSYRARTYVLTQLLFLFFIFLGPIYKSKISVPLPSGLHGTYVNGLVYEQDDIIKVT